MFLNFKIRSRKPDNKGSTDDRLKSMARLSKVSQLKNKLSIQARSKCLLSLIGLVMMLVLIVFVFSGKHKDKLLQHTISASLIADDYHVSLEQNIAALKQKMIGTQAAVDQAAQQANNLSLSKAYRSRQRAPTQMYVTGSNLFHRNDSKHSKSTSVFSGENAAVNFANQNVQATAISADEIVQPNFTIVAGEFIHAVLETAINSDLPGLVRAVVSYPVYAYVGSRLLIPAGSRLLGQYQASVLQGHNRVMIIWNRVVLPDGSSAQINSPGADAIGISGQGADSIDRHFMLRFGEASLLSLIGAGAATYGVSDNDQANSKSNYRSAIAQSFHQSAQNSLQNSLPIKPSLHIFQGANINVFVAHDINFHKLWQYAHE